MSGTYFDTSALVKFYSPEAGSETVRALVTDQSGDCYLSWLGGVEFRSALAIKARLGQLSRENAELTLARLRADVELGLFRIYRGRVGVQSRIASDLLDRFAEPEGLRTLDALQLAAGIELIDAGWVNQLTSADRRFCRVAVLLGVPILDPTAAKDVP